MRTNVLNDLSNVVKKGTILAGSAAAAVDSCAAGGTTLAEYPGNHPVITQLSPRNHPLLDAIWKHVAMIFAVLVMSMANIGMAWGDTELFSTDFKNDWTNTTLVTNGNITTTTPTYPAEMYFRASGSGKTVKITDNGVTQSGNLSVNNNISGVKLTGINGSITITLTHTYSSKKPTFRYYFVDGATAFSSSVSASYSTSTAPSSNGEPAVITISGIKNTSGVFYFGAASSSYYSIASITVTTPSGGCSATANAGADKSTTVGVGVAMAATAASSGYTGAWSIKAGSPSTATSQLSSTSSATATFTPTAAGTYTLVWTVTDNSDGTCSASDEATVTVSAPVVTHDITYTNLKGADNSANPTTYTEGVGVASFANLRHVVGYDFTGWSPSSISSSATTNQTIDAQWTARAAATGTGTLTYALAFESSIITTSSITRNNGALYDATNISTANTSFVSGGEAPGNGCSGKLATTSSKSGSNYVELTFKIADGYTFTPSGVSIRANAVSNNKTLEVELKDNAASPHTKSVTAELAAGSTSGGVTYNLDFSSSPVTLEGTVTLKIYVYGSSGATKGWRIGPSVIVNGTVASAAPSCTAPTSPGITPSNGWLYVPGEEITLTASASNTNASTTYTWYRGATLESAKAAGAIQAAKTSAQGGTTYTIASCTASDAYKYWCEISNGTGCEASASYDIKLYTFFLYNNDNSNNSSHAFTYIDRTNKKLSVTFDVSNATYTYYFKVSDGLGTWYGKNSSTITSATNYCDGLNSSGANVGLTTTLAGSYTVDYYYESNNVVVTYPVPNQTAGQTVYFDNTLTQMSNMYIRIGSTTYSNASSAFTAVPGTAALYQGSTIAWDGFAAWSIADNTGWTGENSIYQPWNGQWTGTGNDYQMSKQTDYQNYAVSGAVTIVPTALHNSEYNCQYYNVDKYNGLLRDRVTITAPVNGTITVNYTSEEGVASSFSATTVDMNQDLAHTVIITPTATPAEGYTLSGLTVNGAAHTSGNTYTVTANTTIAATFSPASYTVTLNTNDGTINAGNVTSYTYGTGATLPTNVTKSGFTFGGWYDNSGLTGSAVTTISTTATGNKEYWAKWTAAASLTALECNTRYTVQDMTAGGCGTLSTTSCYSAGLSANNRFEVLGDPSKTDQAGGTPEQKTNSKQTINSIDFTSFMYLKGDGLNGSTEPTCRGVKFIIPSAGKLTIYYRYGDRSKLKKEGEDAVNVGATTGGYGYDTHDVTAGTYYIYGVSSGAVLIAVEYQCCTTPAAPTAFAAGSITSTGATFSITDAANAASYDIYYSTSSSAPDAGTAATTTSDSKTKAVTGLTANTTYYAWVRSVCDADHKSAWVALTGSTFKTSAAASLTAISADVQYNAADMANITFTGSDQHFTGLSTNHLFKVYGTLGSTDAFGKNETIGNITDDISTKSFTSALYITAANNTSSTSDPTQGAIEFITPSTSGILYLYLNGTASTLTLKKKGTSTSTSLSGAKYKAMTVDANTHYFINGAGSGNRGLYAIKYVSTYAVSITPTNVTKATGATGAGAAIKGKAYTATFTANTGYTLPSDVTVSIGGVAQTKGAGYTWTVSSGTGTLTVPAAQVTGNIVITVTGTAAATYSLTYNCNGAESGCPSNTTASALPNPLPTGLTKDGYTFGGWFTDEDLTVAAVAGATMTGATTLYAKWTVRGSECEDTPHAWDVIATSAKSYKVRISKVTEEVAIPVADATASNLTAYAGSVSTNDNVTVQIADGGSSKYGYKFDGSNTYLKLVFSTPLVLNDTLVVGMTNASHNISFTTTAVRSTTLSTSGGKLIIPAALAGQSTIYLWRGSGSTMYLRSFAVKHECEAIPSCTTPVIPALSNQSLCEGADIAAWNATPMNASTITGKGESISYSWKKKGNATELANTASFDLGASAAESQGGTYVVTVTVSKTGYASSTATKEVTLTVNEATEVTAITADKATVYPTNSVTLTATANMDATWQWYTCSNAEGAGESSIGGATSASYTITAPASAGTYYYKVKATGSCGNAERVYTLTVSAAAGGDCFHYVSVLPDKDISPSSGASIVTPTHATTLEGGTMKVGSQQITITKNGLKLENSKSVSITLDAALEAGNVVIVKGTAASAGNGVSINGVNFYEADSKTFDVSYTVAAGDGLVGKTALTVTKYSGSSYLQEIKITGCGASCTDPEVTASVNNSTACVGSSVTFTATGAHASATYRWQKYSGGAWTDIAGAKAATYNIDPVATTDAMKYRVIATNDCDRTSNEVTLNVPVAPVFADFTATRSVMATQALSITDVEASDATSYAWYKSADATYDAGSDTKVGTAQELLLASGGEASGATYYLFCVASNSCGSTTSGAITVNVTDLVEEDCATRGTEGAAEFGFQNSGCGQGTYNSASCWTMNSNSKILIYSAPDGKYFKTMKVTIASSSASQASYNWSIDGGTTYTSDGVAITGVTTTLTEKTIDLSAHGNVNEVKIGRNFGNGESSGTLYVSKICFEYTSACTTTTVTPSTSSKSHTIGASFTAPTFTLGPAAVSSGTLTYSSSDEEIASVDESGNVTFNGTAGTVTITASYAGATIADVDYCASEGSYTITVSCEGGAPKIVAASSVNMSGCNSSVTLNAKTQAGADFAGGSYQWFRNGEEIAGATSKSYTASQTGVYTVAYTSAGGCTSLSTNNATVTSTTVEPEITKLVPFQYYHVDKTYTAQMKDRHLFSVKGSAAYGSTGKNFKLTMSRNGEAETDITTEASIWVERSDDGQVDNVMIDLNKLSGKYSEGDELVLTCAAVDCSGSVSTVYKDEITIHVIGATPTLALICSGSNEAGGTRNTKKLTVGGDFLTGYNKADLCQQTGNTSFDANTEWGLYTRLKENYIVTPVNGYAVFNKLNYEPFDILLLTDYPKASKSDAAATVLDDMADLCDYRPMLSFKAHMVSKTPSKWAAKGFTTSPVVPKNTRTRLNIVCYAHPMFATLKSTATHIQKDNDDPSQIVYTMLEGAGYESSKGLQGFELEAAENFVTIGLVHYNATPADGSPSAGLVTWTPGSEDRMLVTAVERQENLEARMIMFAVNCGAQSKFTETGRNVVLKCLEYLLDDNPLHVADCSFTFDNGAGNSRDADKQAEDCPSCTGTKGDGKWSTAANWGPDYVVRPGKDTEVKIAAPVTVDNGATNFTPIVRSVRILEGGQVTIPAGSYLEVVSTIRRMDDNDIYPTEANDILIGSSAEGNGTLIFNNNAGDTKARVDMYSNAQADVATMSAATSEWQYIGTPHSDVVSATRNYYDSWLYQYDTGSQGWTVIPNGGPLEPFRGYCVTHPAAPVVFDMEGTLVATTSADIDVPANKYVVAANSWVAPIDINAITDDDMENISDKAIYFFNTGSDPDKEGELNGGDRWAAGTYVSVPIHSAPYTGDDHIPSMQGFYVWSTTAGTLHLDYDRHVRGTSRTNKISGRMHAPKRVQTGDNEPEVLKIIARGNRYDDRLVVLEREDYTRRYDSGWDGEAWGGSDLSPMVYITNEAGVDEAVSAIPEFEGTVITFRAGEDSEYRFEFTYSGETDPLYLYDMDNNTYTQIMTGNAYYFTTSDKAPHSRFILTRKAPQIATGVEPTSDGEGAKARKLLIEDKMYILLNGMLYDATGKVVK